MERSTMGPPPPKIPPVPKFDEKLEQQTLIIPDPETKTHLKNPNESLEIQPNDQLPPTSGETHVAESDETREEIPNPPVSNEPSSSDEVEKSAASSSSRNDVPYSVPCWSQSPAGQPYYIEVLKDGTIIDQLDVSGKGAFMFGRSEICDFVLEHPTISRFHAVIQYKGNEEVFLYDLGSTCGTFINKVQVKGKVYKELHVGDVIRFGQSTRLYLFQGPEELMPPEGSVKKLRDAKMQEEMHDKEASLHRARVQAAIADGISWGIAEDAIEERTEEPADEITWQTYKGKLTERQEKTREKIIKRMEKVANMKKEIDAIQAKEIAQGGLTQGQQTQIARNEQRTSQIMEELENLEETLNQSIQESLGAHTRKQTGKQKGPVEDVEEVSSDEDEFYDRTKRKPGISSKGDDSKSVETADSLLDKKEAITMKMVDIQKSILKERENVPNTARYEVDTGDALDAFMTGVSAQLECDKISQLEKKLGELQSDLDRTMYLLKIADPMGEAAKKRLTVQSASTANKIDLPKPGIPKQKAIDISKSSVMEKPAINCSDQQSSGNSEESGTSAVENKAAEESGKAAECVLQKPLWLGAVKDVTGKDNAQADAPAVVDEPSEFVACLDRKTALAADSEQKPAESTIEAAAPGLIIRKHKQVAEVSTSCGGEHSLSDGAESAALDAVALLLRHSRGYFAADGEADSSKKRSSNSQSSHQEKNPRKVGPEKPFGDNGSDFETWVPPEGKVRFDFFIQVT